MASKLIQQGQGRLAKAPELDPAADDRAPTDTAASPAAALEVSTIPEPHAPSGDGKQLSPREREDLATCEAALEYAGKAFVVAGKALWAIREGRLYRGTHSSFEQYVEEVWDVSRATAHRWIDAWPLGRELSPMGPKVSERQVRALLPVSKTFGQDAAVTVYKTVAETGHVTADVLAGVVAVLPQDSFKPAEVVQQIRAYLAGELTPPAPVPPDPVQTVTSETTKFLRRLQREEDAIKAARESNPELIRQAAASLRAMADKLEGPVELDTADCLPLGNNESARRPLRDGEPGASIGSISLRWQATFRVPRHERAGSSG